MLRAVGLTGLAKGLDEILDHQLVVVPEIRRQSLFFVPLSLLSLELGSSLLVSIGNRRTDIRHLLDSSSILLGVLLTQAVTVKVYHSDLGLSTLEQEAVRTQQSRRLRSKS